MVANSGILSSLTTTASTQLVDKIDSPHSGLFKGLHSMAQGNYALKDGATLGFAHTFTTSSSNIQVALTAGKGFSNGQFIAVDALSATTINKPSSGAFYHWVAFADDGDGTGTISVIMGSSDGVIPDLTVTLTPISLIRVQSTDTHSTVAFQTFTTSKTENKLSIGYENSNTYTEAGSISGTSSGLFITGIGTATVATDDKVLIQDTNASDVIKSVTVSSIVALAGGASLANDGNNRITTADGAGGINGEANLTFDGKSMVVNTDTSGDGAEDLVGLHVDFDRTVASSGTNAHNDIGINLDVNSASLGTSTVIGMDIDVVGATSGTSTATGLTVDVGSADTNYAALFNGGNVGIGTSTPTTLLEVKGDTTLARSADNSETRTLSIEGARFATGTDFARIDLKNYDSNSGASSYVGVRIAAINEATGVDDGSLVLSTANAGSLAERMRIKDSGEVVIGTDLQLSTSSDDVIIQNVTSNKDIILQVNDGGSSGTEVMRIDGSESRVGIGATAPSAKLEVSGDTTISRSSDSGQTRTVIIEGARNATGTDFARLDLKNYDSHGPTSYVGARISAINEVTGVDDGSLTISTADAGTLAERMRITDTGTVGIGTTSPSNILQVNVTGADGNDGIMVVRTDSSTSDGDLLGGIGFDSTDGNVPSSVLESSAFIASIATEDHSTTDKGGNLKFGVSLIDDDDDLTSTIVANVGQPDTTANATTHAGFNSRATTAIVAAATYAPTIGDSGTLVIFDNASSNLTLPSINNTTSVGVQFTVYNQTGSTISAQIAVSNSATINGVAASNHDDIESFKAATFVCSGNNTWIRIG